MAIERPASLHVRMLSNVTSSQVRPIRLSGIISENELLRFSFGVRKKRGFAKESSRRLAGLATDLVLTIGSQTNSIEAHQGSPDTAHTFSSNTYNAYAHQPHPFPFRLGEYEITRREIANYDA